MEFKLVAPFIPTGDQPEAIRQLVDGINKGFKHQVLLGATGTGKTYSMAQVITQVQKPALVMAHNKTLAAQLYAEFKEFFPENAVEYFVSYYDYYQPEAYVPRHDLYIEKETERNEEIERLRLSATTSLMSRQDVIIVASVSAIYGLGNPAEYGRVVINIEKGKIFRRNALLRDLIESQYERNDMDLKPATFRVRGDTLEVIPPTRIASATGSPTSGMKSSGLSSLMPSRVSCVMSWIMSPFTRPSIILPLRISSSKPSRISKLSCTSGSHITASRIKSWKLSASNSARFMTSRCCARSAPVRV
jgi:hypothetical protein